MNNTSKRTTSSKTTKIFAGIFLALVTIGLIVYFIFFNNSTTSLADLDLNAYQISRVEFDDEFFVNEPLSGTLIFKNAEGEEVKVNIKDEGVKTNFDSRSVGTKKLQIDILGKQNFETSYIVNYKDVRIDNYGIVNLSIYNPFELDELMVECIDYYDQKCLEVPFSDISWQNLNCQELSNFTETATANYAGVDLSFEYRVGYLGYGNIYDANYSDDEFNYEINFSLTGLGTGSLTIARESDSIINDENEIKNFSLTYEQYELYDAEYLLISAEESTLEFYNYRTHTLTLNQGIFLNSPQLEFTLELYKL